MAILHFAISQGEVSPFDHLPKFLGTSMGEKHTWDKGVVFPFTFVGSLQSFWAKDTR